MGNGNAFDFNSLSPAITGNIGILIVLAVVVAIIAMCIPGIMTHRLAKKKGYKGYFWTGFFFQFVGLVYVVGLPEKRRHRTKDYE